jgi:hypothetical protein
MENIVINIKKALNELELVEDSIQTAILAAKHNGHSASNILGRVQFEIQDSIMDLRDILREIT